MMNKLKKIGIWLTTVQPDTSFKKIFQKDKKGKDVFYPLGHPGTGYHINKHQKNKIIALLIFTVASFILLFTFLVYSEVIGFFGIVVLFANLVLFTCWGASILCFKKLRFYTPQKKNSRNSEYVRLIQYLFNTALMAFYPILILLTFAYILVTATAIFRWGLSNNSLTNHMIFNLALIGIITSGTSWYIYRRKKPKVKYDSKLEKELYKFTALQIIILCVGLLCNPQNYYLWGLGLFVIIFYPTLILFTHKKNLKSSAT